MSGFNFNYNDVAASAPAEIADGLYDGVIEFSDVKPTKAGVKMINCKIKLANGAVVFDRLNLENASPKAREIAVETVQKLIAFGVANPDAKFTTIESLASYLKGTPVKLFYRNKGVDDKGYTSFSLTFKPVDTALKVTKASAVTTASIY